MRGEVWWARLPEPFKDRPVLLLSREAAYGSRDSVTVAPITGRVRGIATEVPLGRAQGLRTEGVANLDDILTIPQSALDRRVGVLSVETLQEVEDAIQFALGLPPFVRQSETA